LWHDLTMFVENLSDATDQHVEKIGEQVSPSKNGEANSRFDEDISRWRELA